MDETEREKHIVRGVLADRDIPEYTELYDRVMDAAKAAREQNAGGADEEGPGEDAVPQRALAQAAGPDAEPDSAGEDA